MAILSISSEYGTGALRIGHAIEEQLGYEYIPLRRLLREAGQSGKKWERLAAKYTRGPLRHLGGQRLRGLHGPGAERHPGPRDAGQRRHPGAGQQLFAQGGPPCPAGARHGPPGGAHRDGRQEGGGQPRDGAASGQAGRPGDRLLDAPGLRAGLGRSRRCTRSASTRGPSRSERSSRSCAACWPPRIISRRLRPWNRSGGSLWAPGSRRPCWPTRR